MRQTRHPVPSCDKRDPTPCTNTRCRYSLARQDAPDSHTGAPGCALDVAKAAPEGLPLEEVGKLLGVTRERVRQIEERALEKMRRAARKLKLAA
jgi:hypothetical protein